MTSKNPAISMDIRALAHDEFTVVLTHKNGEKTGAAMTAARAIELIDDLELS